MDTKTKKFIKIVGYIGIWVLLSIPLFCAYIIDGGQAQKIVKGISKGTEFWYMLPHVLLQVGVSIVTIYKIMYWFWNSISVISSVWLMEQIAGDDNLVKLCGVAFFCLNPRHICMCYDEMIFSNVVLWAFVPLGLGAIIATTKNSFKKSNWVIAICTFTGILYTVASNFKLYIYPENDGYFIEECFTSYAYPDGKTGIGMGILLGIIVLGYVCFVVGESLNRKWIVLALFAVALFVGSLKKQSIWGLEIMALCLLATKGMMLLRNREQRTCGQAICVTTFLITCSNALYICNMLTYYRPPLIWK